MQDALFNHRFFEFALELRRANLDQREIETTLRLEAEFGRSPKKRKAQVKIADVP